MCGIIGYVGVGEAVPRIVEGLLRLEYRGYDSAGVAAMTGDGIHVVKRRGRIAALQQALADEPLKSRLAVGHTRWATHGEPSDINAHPHLSQDGRIAIVHNGIIENHAQLRRRLENKGIVFRSDTDSEVIAHLAEWLYDGDLIRLAGRLSELLEGAYALGILCKDQPESLLAVRRDSPLIVGLSGDGNYIASDVPALLRHTRRIVAMRDGEIAVLRRDGASLFGPDGERIEPDVQTIDWPEDSAELDGHAHYMIKEIFEQPGAIRDTVRSVSRGGVNEAALAALDLTRFDRIAILGCGSAYNAGMVGKYVLEPLLRMPVEVDLASEFRYRDPLVDARTLCVFISQSGETADTVAALREARRRCAPTLAIVNARGSTLAREADHVLHTLAGPEIAVATTKAFSTQLAMLYMIGAHCAGREDLFGPIGALPEAVADVLAHVERVQQCAAGCFSAKTVFFIGRGIDSAAALEGALKLKEISYIHSEAYAGGELKHGPISLVEDGTLVVALSGSKRLLPKTMSNVEQVLARGARVLMVTADETVRDTEHVTVLRIPQVPEPLSASLTVVMLQLLSYYLALGKGTDIDKPRNLAKSVTVE